MVEERLQHYGLSRMTDRKARLVISSSIRYRKPACRGDDGSRSKGDRVAMADARAVVVMFAALKLGVACIQIPARLAPLLGPAPDHARTVGFAFPPERIEGRGRGRAAGGANLSGLHGRGSPGGAPKAGRHDTAELSLPLSSAASEASLLAGEGRRGVGQGGLCAFVHRPAGPVIAWLGDWQKRPTAESWMLYNLVVTPAQEAL